MWIKVSLVVACAAAVVLAFEPEPNPYDNPIYFGDEFLSKWEAFRQKFNKTYPTSTEEAVRMMMFRMNLMIIDTHNAKAAAEGGFEMGVTYFTDFSPREFGKVLGTNPALHAEGDESGEDETNEIEGRQSDEDSDDGVDYMNDSCIGPVEHQMTCGSCWAFSVLHVAGWHYCKKTGKYTNFAEQQLVDCSKKDNGCTSGYTKTAAKYIAKNGILEEGAYPYQSKKDKCHKDLLADESKLHRPISGTKNVGKNEKAMKKALQDKGPLMIIIDATNLAFYTQGVISGSFCEHGEVNHAVVLVGSKDKTWKVKNSWGPDWGESGYFRLEMNNAADKGCLGVSGYPSYAIPN